MYCHFFMVHSVHAIAYFLTYLLKVLGTKSAQWRSMILVTQWFSAALNIWFMSCIHSPISLCHAAEPNCPQSIGPTSSYGLGYRLTVQRNFFCRRRLTRQSHHKQRRPGSIGLGFTRRWLASSSSHAYCSPDPLVPVRCIRDNLTLSNSSSI